LWCVCVVCVCVCVCGASHFFQFLIYQLFLIFCMHKMFYNSTGCLNKYSHLLPMPLHFQNIHLLALKRYCFLIFLNNIFNLWFQSSLFRSRYLQDGRNRASPRRLRSGLRFYCSQLSHQLRKT